MAGRRPVRGHLVNARSDCPHARRRGFLPLLCVSIVVLAVSAGGCGSKAKEAEHPGKAVYLRYCYACHQAGIADAPKYGDKEAWALRLAKPRGELLANVKRGMAPGMPPRGGCGACTDEALGAAVEYMTRKVE